MLLSGNNWKEYTLVSSCKQLFSSDGAMEGYAQDLKR